MPGVEFEFHAQRSPVVLDRLRSGEYMVGICTGARTRILIWSPR